VVTVASATLLVRAWMDESLPTASLGQEGF
jgi:hypothetical protein